MHHRIAQTLGLLLLAHGLDEARAIDIERLESRVPVLEEEVLEACANERPGEARASLAYLSYNRANSLREQLDREVAAVDRILDGPEELVQRQLELDYARAREASRLRSLALLEFEVRRLDWIRLRSDGEEPPELEEQRERVRKAKRLHDYYTRRDAVSRGVIAPEQMRKLLSVKIETALGRLRQLSALGRRLDAAASRAWGCWTTATNSGKPVETAPALAAQSPLLAY
jgi:hypothetical protein